MRNTGARTDSVERGSDRDAKFSRRDGGVLECNGAHRDAVEDHLTGNRDHRIVLAVALTHTRSQTITRSRHGEQTPKRHRPPNLCDAAVYDHNITLGYSGSISFTPHRRAGRAIVVIARPTRSASSAVAVRNLATVQLPLLAQLHLRAHLRPGVEDRLLLRPKSAHSGIHVLA